MFKNFIHYYQARGKEEIKSVLLTLVSGFFLAFGALMFPVILQVTYGEWTMLSEVVTMSTVVTAVIRSIGGAILYTIWPDYFKFRVTGVK